MSDTEKLEEIRRLFKQCDGMGINSVYIFYDEVGKLLED